MYKGKYSYKNATMTNDHVFMILVNDKLRDNGSNSFQEN